MAKKSTGGKNRAATGGAKAEWDLRLYVAGPTTRAVKALANLEKLC